MIDMDEGANVYLLFRLIYRLGCIGMALMKIRDERLYRKDYSTVEDYCRDRWQFQRSYANKLIASAGVVKNIGTGTIVPKTEFQARPLAKLPPEELKFEVLCLSY